jgi:predicted HicB family RNase H-like nuclease
MIKYKGYVGRVVYDSKLKVFHGDVIGLTHVITFEGTSPETIEKSFKDAIDDYLEMCEAEGIIPEKTFSGKFVLRLSSDLHQTLAHEAALQNKSLNEYVVDTLNAIHKIN